MGAHIGTSGWSYPEWSPAFYPPELAREDYLPYYAARLTACEINSTHYRLPSLTTVARWANAVPTTFRFAVKLHRRLTDRPSFRWDAADLSFLDRFIASLEPLGQRLGALLIQPSDDMQRDDEALEANLTALPEWLPAVVELRHPSWNTQDVRRVVTDSGSSLVHTETSGGGPPDGQVGPVVYLRLRAEHYDDASRATWLRHIREIAQDGLVYAIARHDGLPSDDPHCGVQLARWLRENL